MVVLVQQTDPNNIPSWGSWGGETNEMYALWQQINDSISEKKDLPRSIGVVCNGGGITVAEVVLSILQGRQLFVLANTGRTADMLASLLDPQFQGALSDEQEKLKTTFLSAMQKHNVPEEIWKTRFTVVALEPGQEEGVGKLKDTVQQYLDKQ